MFPQRNRQIDYHAGVLAFDTVKIKVAPMIFYYRMADA
jgi:hypothetical protein